jgi:two-component system phosphate regulon response regulator PhoB
VIAAADGSLGLEFAVKHRPDLIVLDLMMPGIDGLEVCRRLRADERSRSIPVIMLTARATEADRIVGLELGADDYMVKPFSPRELMARVKAVLRRSDPAEQSNGLIRRGDLEVDAQRHEVMYKGKSVGLTATEFRILHYFVLRPGRVLSRDDIIDSALGSDSSVFDRTIDVHITALRKKLGRGGELIETVRGFGYKLKDR